MNDFMQANVNGIRFVMPDMGISGIQRPVRDASAGGNNMEWTASTSSLYRNNSWTFDGRDGISSTDISRTSGYRIRCVGR